MKQKKNKDLAKMIRKLLKSIGKKPLVIYTDTPVIRKLDK